MSAGYVHVRVDTLKEIRFTEDSAAIEEQPLPPLKYDTVLVLTNGSRVPAANLLRVSAQAYSAAPASGVDAGTVYTPQNDVDFFKARTAPTIEFEDIQSMEFPSENSILLTLRQGATQVSADPNQAALEDFDLLKGDIENLNLTDMDPNAGRLAPKNWAYGFSGVFDRGFFFIPAEHVKAVEFVSENKE